MPSRTSVHTAPAETSQSETSLSAATHLRRGISHGLFVFLVATLLALLEVQIEGPNGWARALPTWRLDGELVKTITGGRPITGYHVYLWLLLLALLHAPVLFTKFTRELEARLLGWFLLLTVSWDFLWFIWNPSFGLSSFQRENIWWYTRWILGIPIDYYVGILLSLLVYLAGAGSRAMIRVQAQEWTGTVLALLALTAATIAIVLL